MAQHEAAFRTGGLIGAAKSTVSHGGLSEMQMEGQEKIGPSVFDRLGQRSGEELEMSN